MNPGDSVTWTDTISRGDSIHFHSRTGKVVAVCGEEVEVKGRGGHRYFMNRSRLRLASERSELTQFVQENWPEKGGAS